MFTNPVTVHIFRTLIRHNCWFHFHVIAGMSTRKQNAVHALVDAGYAEFNERFTQVRWTGKVV